MATLYAIKSIGNGRRVKVNDFTTNEKIEYRIYIKSVNKNPRTINTYMMCRCYYEKFEVVGYKALVEKINILQKAGAKIYEVRGGFNTSVYGF